MRDDVFDARFQELQEFKAKHWHVLVPKSPTPLGKWLALMRLAMKGKGDTKLTPKQVQALADIGVKTRPDKKTFDDWFAELVAFKAKHGHCDAPVSCELGRWAYVIRRAMRGDTKHVLPEAHRRRLEKLGVNPSFRVKTFEERYAELVAYKEKTGRVNLTRANGSLGQWMANIRMAAKGKCSLTVTPEQIRRLEELGVWFERPDVFEERFAELVAFKAKHGHANATPPASVGAWLANIRWSYNRGAKCRVTPEQVERLKELGVSFEPRFGKHRNHSFERRLKELEVFKADHGHCNIPIYSGLWWWLVNVRRGLRSSEARYRRTRLSEEQVARLVAVGVRLGEDEDSSPAVRFERHFEEIVAYKAEHGHCNIPQVGSAVGSWLSSVRHRYRSGVFAGNTEWEPRIEKLKAIGVDFGNLKQSRKGKS